MTQPPEFIDVGKVEKELVTALEADRKYSRENDAKFRAVNQRVATYEEFRDIVKASHLNCLDRDDISGKKARKQPWNPLATSLEEGSGFHGDPPSDETHTYPNITNLQEFMREWKRLKETPKDQYLFLLNIGSDHLYSLFKTEISILLGEFLTVLNLCFTTEDSDAVVKILRQLSACSRFKLALGFLRKDQKRAAEELVAKLKGGGVSEDNRTEELFKMYTC